MSTCFASIRAAPHTYIMAPSFLLRIAACQGYSPNSVSPSENAEAGFLTRPRSPLALRVPQEYWCVRALERKTGRRQHTWSRPQLPSRAVKPVSWRCGERKRKVRLLEVNRGEAFRIPCSPEHTDKKITLRKTVEEEELSKDISGQVLL